MGFFLIIKSIKNVFFEVAKKCFFSLKSTNFQKKTQKMFCFFPEIDKKCHFFGQIAIFFWNFLNPVDGIVGTNAQVKIFTSIFSKLKET